MKNPMITLSGSWSKVGWADGPVYGVQFKIPPRFKYCGGIFWIINSRINKVNPSVFKLDEICFMSEKGSP
jgi:hypothetical protein